jgi:hypothetical protein
VLIGLLGDDVEVLVRAVAEAEDDVFDAIETVPALGEFEGLVGEVLEELHGVVGRFALTVGGHDEDRARVLRDLVEVLEVVLLRVADEGREAELGLRLLCDADSILLSRASL